MKIQDEPKNRRHKVLNRFTKISYLNLQWRANIFGHLLKSHNFFQINPNDLSFFEKLEGLNDVIRRFEKNALGRNRKKKIGKIIF